MNIASEVALSLILLITGFFATYNYLHEIKWNKFEKDSVRITRNKLLYLVCGLAIAALLITLFQLVYKQTFITQVKLLVLVFIVLPCAAADYKVHKIPNQFIVTALIIRTIIYAPEFINSASSAFTVLKNDLIGAVVIGGFFLIILLIFKNSIGMGDVKLFAVMGLYQGLWGAINSVFFSLVVSFFISVFLLITKKKGRKDVISFGPSILLGTVVAIAISGM